MKLQKFLGINNVADRTRLADGEMLTATNVDIGSTGNVLSRRGRTLLRAGSAHSLFESPFGTFAVINSDLVLLNAAGALLRTVYPTLGYTRVWYTLLADGRVAFSNGYINGLATATTTTEWGIKAPESVGYAASGTTMYALTHVRLSDGLEGPAIYGPPSDLSSLTGLPVREGFSINIYTAPYGEELFLAGNTTTDTAAIGSPGVAYLGAGLAEPPVGTQLTTWLSRVLIVEGSTLWATRPFQPEMIDLTRDFVQMPRDITLVYGTNSGVFIGTSEGITWLDGTSVAEWKSQPIATGAVTLGSAVEIPLGYLQKEVRPSGLLQGALCLVGGVVHLIYGNGQILALTSHKYKMDATEVIATARVRDGVMQYLAAPV